ncbi:Galactoside O-acetyltransferase [Allocatenococcus thiocycli]|nr:Galactoside O-acetyltransferase [Catenococcus thiocycli]
MVEIGNDTYLNFNTRFGVFDSRVIIGSKVLVGPNVSFETASHSLSITRELFTKPIIIKDNVWIGAGSIIIQGVTIAEGSVIGAGSIVTNDTEPFSVYAGVPAKKIKDIQNDQYHRDK